MTWQKQNWSRVRRELWRPPRAHGRQPQHRVVGPLELFYDLTVVVLIGQAAHHLADHLTWRGLAEFAVIFALVWIAWLNGTLHHELHGYDDARGRVMFLLQILILIPLGAFIPKAGSEQGAAFAITAGILFAVLALLWYLAGRGDTPEFRKSSGLYVAGTATCAAILMASALLPPDARLLTWGLLALAALGGLAAIIALASPAQAAAFTITDALTERFGLLIIIVLGETVIGVVDGLSGEPTSATGVAVGLGSVLVGFGAWWTYFDFAGHRPPHRTRGATVQWLLLHLPLTAAVTAMGAAMPTLIEHAHDDRTPPATAWVLCAGAAIVLCATMALAASLQAWENDRRLYRPLARISVLVAVAAAALGALRPPPLALALTLFLLLGVPWLFAVAHRLSRAEEPTP
ncbi:low temperature requirement protein A [Actinacidiphila paucisporea]|uniref:Low temperature requirement protein LtrA n=1 Tax=Actinacidiphila paucisporea TaxID=310782 RepID=A0A1M7QVR2_9ACTN|nr:low temperature requirement protein A [Actinacidiphila paucisporea]SHN35949.1 Low temperature requirement protein LtrA [Actinacidiphila paucisporea]